MCNESSRRAMFQALHDRPEFQPYIPTYRTFYGKPARIFLVREEGELRVPIVKRAAAAGTDGGADGGDDGDEGDAERPSVAAARTGK